MKLLTSVVHIFSRQEFGWMFNLRQLQQNKTVNNDLQESLSADPLRCVFVHTHSPVSVHTLTIRLVFHKQMLTQDSCSTDIAALNYIHVFPFLKAVLVCLGASETWQLRLLLQILAK